MQSRQLRRLPTAEHRRQAAGASKCRRQATDFSWTTRQFTSSQSCRCYRTTSQRNRHRRTSSQSPRLTSGTSRKRHKVICAAERHRKLSVLLPSIRFSFTSRKRHWHAVGFAERRDKVVANLPSLSNVTTTSSAIRLLYRTSQKLPAPSNVKKTS